MAVLHGATMNCGHMFERYCAFGDFVGERLNMNVDKYPDNE